MSGSWKPINADPTAGVSLATGFIYCTRCGVLKGKKWDARPGLCVDCREVLTPAERRAWMS